MSKKNTGNNSLRVGIIGFGKMALHHLKAIKSTPGAHLVAVADPRIDEITLPESVASSVETYISAEELIAESKPDIVHIVTPPATHHSIARLALDNGIHVYIEKPFISTVAEAEDILAAAKSKGLKVCAGHQLLFTRVAGLLRNSLDSIGRVVHIESYFSFRTVRRGISPTDQLADILPHPVYLLEDFLQRSRSDKGSRIKFEAVTATHDGEARALLSAGDVTGSLVVTLSGRPVNSYVKIIGTNGCLHADFVRGFIVKSPGPGSSIFSILLTPYFQASQLLLKITGAIFRLFSDRKKGSPGLPEILTAFYKNIREDSPEPISPEAVWNTVTICEAVETKARKAEEAFETKAAKALEKVEKSLPPTVPGRGRILLTGGTGLFGRPTAALLRNEGWPVTVLSRNVPPVSKREPGVEYVKADLGEPIAEELMDDVETVIHAAAETAGGQSAQERNSIQATRMLLDAAERSGVSRFVHISSLGVLKPGDTSGKNALDESSPVDLNNLSRGPYVWGKAESEHIATVFGDTSRMQVKIVRLGPLVDYSDYKPPGRLGREIHNLFVAVGSSKDPLSVCSVQTASRVMLVYMADFDSMPPILNLVEPDPPRRGELLARWKEIRSPLYSVWLPTFVLSIMSPLLIMMQRVVLRGKKPVDIKSAFSSERYDTAKAASILKERDCSSAADAGSHEL